MLVKILTDYAIPSAEALSALLLGTVVYYLYVRMVNRVAAAGYIPLVLRSALISIARILLFTIVTLLGLGFFGVSVATFWAALSGVLVMVGVGFVAMWSVLSNIFCAVLLAVFAPFRIGDEIEIQDPAATATLRGRVIGIDMMFVSLSDASAEGVIVRVPNNLIFQKYVRCWPGSGTHSLRHFLSHDRSKTVD